MKRSPPFVMISLGLALCLTSGCNTSNFKGTSAKVSPTVTRSFTQDDYPAATTTHKQGHAGEPQSQKFAQGEWGALDLLVVIDNSGSMIEEQANLSTKLQPLLSKVDRADWQIAVVTTDPADGCQRALIKKSDPDAAAKFQAAVNAGTKGSGLERPVYQAVEALKASCAGATKWVRPGSTLSILIVTDEDNCHIDDTQGYGCQGLADADGKYLTDYLSTIRTLGKDARTYGLLWHPSTTQAECTTALKQATQIASIIDASSGKWGSICDKDYTTTLTAMSADIAQIVKYEFDLTQEPDAGTLKITVDAKPWTDFELDAKHVKFTTPPPFGSKVEVAYTVGAQGELATDFLLDKAPVDGSIVATIDGQPVPVAGLKVDAAAKKVSFAEAPAASAEVKFAYKESVPLRSAFVLDAAEVDPATLVVVVNDLPLATAQFKYAPATKTVTIDPPPPALAKIRISYKDR